MKIRKSGRFIGGYSALTVFVASLVFLPAGMSGQGKLADYERAFGLRDHYLGLVRNLPERAVWVDKTNRFWYRKNVKGSYEFVLVDAAALAKKAAFDQEKLLLSVGEMDQNVDPASTMQVVNALIKANKTFDLLVLPGQGHTTGGEYGDRERYDFFVRHLLGVEPPDWNRIAPKKPEEK